MKKIQSNDILNSINHLRSLNKLSLEELYENFNSKSQFLNESIPSMIQRLYGHFSGPKLGSIITIIDNDKKLRSKLEKSGIELDSTLPEPEFFERLKNTFNENEIEYIISKTVEKLFSKTSDPSVVLTAFTREIAKGKSFEDLYKQAFSNSKKKGRSAYDELANTISRLKANGIPKKIIEDEIRELSGQGIDQEVLNKLMGRMPRQRINKLIEEYPFIS